MKVLLWIGSGANHKALAHKIHRRFPLAGIVVETRSAQQNRSMAFYAGKFIERLFLSSISASWHRMMTQYHHKYPAYPETKILHTRAINTPEVSAFCQSIQPDVIAVSGTSLIKEELLALKPPGGIVNLHTGVSPFVKGGPNCTNWCIANGDFHLIGNTVMWIDAGIDSGNIIASEVTPFDEVTNLFEIQFAVMEHAHDLYVRSIEALSKGLSQSVPQKKLGEGKTYYTRQWGLREKLRLIRRLPDFRKSLKSGERARKQKSVTTVPLPK